MVKTYTKLYSALTISLTIFVFSLITFIISAQPKPVGSDPYFHLELGTLYTQGNFTGAWNLMFNTISYFYPPLFHIIIDGPIALSSNPYLGLKIAECLFMPLTYLTTTWLIWKYSGAKAAFITGITLLGSISFIDGTLQARPESLDLLIFPIIIYAVLETKKKTAGILSALIVWSHGLAAISSIFGIFIYKLFDKQWRKTLLLITIAVAPVIILSFIYFEGAIQFWLLGQTSTTNPQNYLFWHNPFPWIIYYCGLTLLGIPFLFKKNKTQLELLLTYAFIGNSFMVIFWADRWLHYATIPLAALYGIGISRWHGTKLYLALTFSAAITIIYIINLLFVGI
jgi:hypothetical protein